MTPAWYHDIFKKHQSQLSQYSHLYIGLSAGIDSNILLHWLYTFKAQLPPITAIHVNHQWHGEDSFIWADFARKSAGKYDFPFINYDVTIDIDQKGAEACGREARYIKFAETMAAVGGEGLLLVAHHRSDQAETIMYRLVRGSGTLGLGGMKSSTELHFGAHKLHVLRPFLTISKSILYETGRALGVDWMEDYTNHETEEARNQIRNAIFPVIARYFPHYEQTFARSAELIQESDALLTEIAEKDYQNVVIDNQVLLDQLFLLSSLRRHNLLRYWLRLNDVILEKRQFDEFLSMFFGSQPTSQSCFNFSDWMIRFFQNKLYFLKDVPCLSSKLTWIDSENAPSMKFWNALDLEMKTRENGMSFHPIWRDRSQTVKKLLQEIELEPWHRSNVQFLRRKDTQEIVWMEHLGISRNYQSECQSQGYLPRIIESVKE